MASVDCHQCDTPLRGLDEVGHHINPGTDGISERRKINIRAQGQQHAPTLGQERRDSRRAARSSVPVPRSTRAPGGSAAAGRTDQTRPSITSVSNARPPPATLNARSTYKPAFDDSGDSAVTTAIADRTRWIERQEPRVIALIAFGICDVHFGGAARRQSAAERDIGR